MAVDKRGEKSDDLSEQDQVEARNKALKLTEAQRKDLVRGLMGTEVGRAWMFDFLIECHIYHAIFPTDQLRMAFSEGERNVGLKLLTEVTKAAPQEYILMMEERNG